MLNRSAAQIGIAKRLRSEIFSKGIMLSLLLSLIITIFSGCTKGGEESINPSKQEQTNSSPSTALTEPTTEPTEYSTDSNPPTTEPATEPTEPTEPPKTTSISTPYGEFTFSGYWQGEMLVEFVQGKTIRALCQTGSQSRIHLFDITFGEAEGECMGYLATESDSYLPVYLKLSDVEPDSSWTAEEEQDYYAMQSQINSILSNLELEQDPPTEPSEQGTVELQTPYFTLNYASPNAHCLRTEHRDGEDYCISFYGTPEGMTEMHLYDIRLSTTDQGAIGFYTTEDGVVLYLHVENVEEYAMDDWSDSSREQMNQLMEGINDLLLALSDSEAFTYF
jgi:hypothetical protein